MKWALVAKADIKHVRAEALRLRDYLVACGQETLLETRLAAADGSQGYTLDELNKEASIFMTVGGDGTILLVTQHTQKPVLGVNAGAVGFLAEIEPSLAKLAVDRVVEGRYTVDERDKLAVRLNGEPLPDATNEVTLQTSRIAKLIQFNITVDGEVLDVMRGDGVIISTPTGSTGYAMSVGGPLVHPRVKGVVLAPIAPFRLAARPWVIPEDSEIELTLLERDSSQLEKPARVVIDGQYSAGVAAGDQVMITPSTSVARFVRLDAGFYERVRRKLVR